MNNDIKYELIMYWSVEDNLYIVDVPKLSGCKADASSYFEALSNAEIIMNEWIETAKLMGREIPKPKGKLVFA